MGKSFAELLMEKEADLDKSMQRSYDTRESGFTFGSIFIPNCPLPILRLKSGDHSMDILLGIAGKNHPLMPEGAGTYNVDLYMHMNIGPNRDPVVCMYQTFGGKHDCFICQYKNKYTSDEDHDLDYAKTLNASRRCVYFVWCHDKNEEEKGVQVIEISHHLFEKQLISMAQPTSVSESMARRIKADEDFGKAIKFASIGPEGRMISFSITGKGVGKRIDPIRMHKRNYTIPEHILKVVATTRLDSLIHWPTYDEVKQLFLSGLESLDDQPQTQADETSVDTLQRLAKQEEAPPQRNLPMGDDKKDDPCPHGGEFGPSFQKIAACLECDLIRACMLESNKAKQGSTVGVSGNDDLDIPF